MKKITLALLFIGLGTFCKAQDIIFTDINFRSVLVSAAPNNTTATNLTGENFRIDSNFDNIIQVSEALQVKSLNLENSFIRSLDGISNFENLKSLHCSNNLIETLDLTNLSNLQQLTCLSNKLTSLNVVGLSNLLLLSCVDNDLTSLDLTGLNQLETLGLGLNPITNIDLSNMQTLKTVDCSQTLATTISFPVLGNIETLGCTNSLLTMLDISNLHHLVYVNISNNENLRTIYMKRTRPSWGSFYLNGNNSLEYICADEDLIPTLQSMSNSGLPTHFITDSDCVNLALNENERKSAVVMYPNPATTIFHIQSEKEILKTEIFDINGRLVKTTDKTEIDISHFSKGLFIIKVYANDEVFQRKLIKQ